VAVPFDRATLRTWEQVGVVDGVMQPLNVPYVDVETGAAQFDVAEDGTLVYAPGGRARRAAPRALDRSGRVGRWPRRRRLLRGPPACRTTAGSLPLAGPDVVALGVRSRAGDDDAAGVGA
jgi:rRNA processing protein Gar1